MPEPLIPPDEADALRDHFADGNGLRYWHLADLIGAVRTRISLRWPDRAEKPARNAHARAVLLQLANELRSLALTLEEKP